MSWLLVLFLLVDFRFLIAKPINKTFYDVLESECPYISQVPTFKSQDILKNCIDWTNINQTQSLTKDTENNVLCLLYFDSFKLFCTELTKQINLLKLPGKLELKLQSTVFLPILEDDMTVTDVCKNLRLFPSERRLEHITKLITKEEQCYKLCSTYDINPVKQCSLAYHFAKLNVTALVQSSTSSVISKASDDIKTKGGGAEAPLGKPNGKPEEHQVVPVQKSETEVKPETELNPNVPEGVPNKPKSVPRVEQNSGGDAKAEEQAPKELPAPKSPMVAQAAAAAPSSAAAPEHAVMPLHAVLEPHEVLAAAVIPPRHDIESKSAVNAVPANQAVPPALPIADEKAAVEAPAGQKPEEQQASSAGKDKAISNEPVPPVDDKGTLKEQEDDATDVNKESNEGVIPEQLGEEDGFEDTQDGKDETEDGKDETQDGKDETQDGKDEAVQVETVKEKPKNAEKLEDNIPISYSNAEDIDGESYFFSYFMAICVLFVLGYVGYHNRKKVMALVLEGKRGKRQYRGRRPNSANYHKLDSNLEEAISSTCTKNMSHVIY